MPEPIVTPVTTAGDALQRAISAEQEVRRAIADAETAAAATVEAARTEARSILSAVPQRISRLRRRGSKAVERALATIASEEADAMRRMRDTVQAPERLEQSVLRVVRRLTGEDP